MTYKPVRCAYDLLIKLLLKIEKQNFSFQNLHTKLCDIVFQKALSRKFSSTWHLQALNSDLKTRIFFVPDKAAPYLSKPMLNEMSGSLNAETKNFILNNYMESIKKMLAASAMESPDSTVSLD